MLIPLKLKYRTPNIGFKCGSYKNRNGNSHGPRKRSVTWHLSQKKR